jgi:hypothetical protein
LRASTHLGNVRPISLRGAKEQATSSVCYVPQIGMAMIWVLTRNVVSVQYLKKNSQHQLARTITGLTIPRKSCSIDGGTRGYAKTSEVIDADTKLSWMPENQRVEGWQKMRSDCRCSVREEDHDVNRIKTNLERAADGVIWAFIASRTTFPIEQFRPEYGPISQLLPALGLLGCDFLFHGLHPSDVKWSGNSSKQLSPLY